MSGAARRFALLAFVALEISAAAAGPLVDRMVVESDILELEIVRRSDGAMLDSGTALIRRGSVLSLGMYGNLNVAGHSVSQIETAIIRHMANLESFPENVDVRVRYVAPPSAEEFLWTEESFSILYSQGEGIAGRSLKPLATGPSSSIAIVHAPDILSIKAIRRTNRSLFISGGHLTRPDGTVCLGIYGNVDVAGLTVPAARRAITKQLAKHGYAARDIDVTVEIEPYR